MSRPVEGVQAAPSAAELPVAQMQNFGPASANLAAQNSMLMADPRYRNALLAQGVAGLRAANPGLVEEMGLSSQEAEEMFQLIASHQIELNEEISRIRSNGPMDSATRARIQSVQEEGQSRLQDSLAAQLGQDRLRQYTDYQETRTARNSVASIGNTLALAGQPLSTAQLRPFMSAMAAAQKRQQAALPALPRNAATASSAAATQRREQEQKRLEETNRILLEAAERHLTQSQLGIYRAQLDAQVAEISAWVRVQQERDRVLRAMQGERN
ncbi:MAG TPA: hypothetical protein VNQ32_06025 [Steroidobacteraceae bacterium]|nr:hypothetical protein [Steroidobacteraceae bacterium]